MIYDTSVRKLGGKQDNILKAVSLEYCPLQRSGEPNHHEVHLSLSRLCAASPVVRRRKKPYQTEQS